LQYDRSVTGQGLRVDDSARNENLGVVRVEGISGGGSHGKEDILCDKHGIAIKIGSPWTRHTVHTDSIRTTTRSEGQRTT
jgi:hypothetical protein